MVKILRHTSNQVLAGLQLAALVSLLSIFGQLLVLATEADIKVQPDDAQHSPLELEVALEEVEAHLEVEGVLNEVTADTQDYTAFLRKSTETMKIMLESQLESQFRAGTSREGEIRGYSRALMRELVAMYQLANECKLAELAKGSERVGGRCVQIEKQLETSLVCLDEYLASLFRASQDVCSEPGRLEGEPEGASWSGPKGEGHKKKKKKKGWWDNLLSWINL